MSIDNLSSLQTNKENYPNIKLPSDPKYYVSAEEYNMLVKTLQTWISDYNLRMSAFEGSVYDLPIVTTNSYAPFTDQNILSAARALVEISKMVTELKGSFLSKIVPDEALGKITFTDGIEIGKPKKGFIDETGHAELKSLKLQEWLEVPELRFNRIEIQSGDKWRAPGGGIIESVDTANRTFILKLEDGEVGAVSKDDLCVGIFHSLNPSNNSNNDFDNGEGVRYMAGFATSYFKIESVENGPNGEFNKIVHYSLRNDTDYNRPVHPEKFMHFAVFGNTSNTARQTSVYETRTYQRYLINVDKWKISPYNNIAAQFGDLTNLDEKIVTGTANRITGYSAYLNNVYFTGTIQQIKAPKIIEGYWHIWNSLSQRYENTFEKATMKGEDGISSLYTNLINKNITVSKDVNEFPHSWAELHVFEGNTELTYSTTSLTSTDKGKYTVYIVADGVVAGDLNLINTPEGAFLRTSPIEQVINDQSTIKFFINGKRLDGTNFTMYETQTVVALYSGKDGENGKDGKDGENGKDGMDVEYIFTRTTGGHPSIPVSTNEDDPPEGWTKDPYGVDDTWKFEWYVRRLRNDEGVWGPWHNLLQWRYFVADGHDGKDGIDREYIFLTIPDMIAPAKPDENENIADFVPTKPAKDIHGETITYLTDDVVTNVFWKDDESQEITSIIRPVTWYCLRKNTGGKGDGVVPGVWGEWTNPKIWSKRGKDGKDGKDGEDGLPGSSAPLLILNASSNVMQCSPNKVPYPGQIISIKAKTQNTTADLIWEVVAHDENPGVAAIALPLSPPEDNPKELILSSDITPPYWTSTIKQIVIHVRSPIGLNATVTIHRLVDSSDGANAVVGYLTNENINLVGRSDGIPMDLSNAEGYFKIFDGLTDVSENVIYGVKDAVNCTVTINNTPIRGKYKVTNFSVNDFDTGYVTLTASYTKNVDGQSNTIVIEKKLWITISRRGEQGKPGTSIPIVFRGEYKYTSQYYGNEKRIDIVKFGDSYYKTATTIGEYPITGIDPNNGEYWESFGSHYESVATDLLLAEKANIAGFVFYQNQMLSQIGRLTNGNTKDFGDLTQSEFSQWYPNIVLDGIEGNVIINKGTFRGDISANSGNIGGWLLDKNIIHSQVGTYTDNGTVKPVKDISPHKIMFKISNSAPRKWDNYWRPEGDGNNNFIKLGIGLYSINYTDQIPFGIYGPNATHNIKGEQIQFAVNQNKDNPPSTENVWNDSPTMMGTPLTEGNYLWLRKRYYQRASYQSGSNVGDIVGVWSTPIRYTPMRDNHAFGDSGAIVPSVLLNGNDGSGWLSGGAISWDDQGNVTMKGIYKSNNEEILLRPDGSGKLASGSISWNATGDSIFTGKINATSGEIGGFTITSGRLGVAQSGDNPTSDGMALYNDFIKFSNSGTSVFVGTNVLPATTGTTAMMRLTDGRSGWGYKYGSIIEVSGATSVDGANNNIALDIVKGVTRGLRWAILAVSLTSDRTFGRETELVCYLSASGRTVYLPSNPEIGEMKIVTRVNNYGLTVNGNGKTIVWSVGNSSATVSFGPDNTLKQMALLFRWDGNHWLVAGW